jgi:hypothetical protein
MQTAVDVETRSDREAPPVATAAAAPRARAAAAPRVAGWRSYALLLGHAGAVISAAVLASADHLHHRGPALIVFLISLGAVKAGGSS